MYIYIYNVYLIHDMYIYIYIVAEEFKAAFDKYKVENGPGIYIYIYFLF